MRYIEPKLLPIRHINLNIDSARISARDIKAQITPHLKGFFSTDMIVIKKQILKDPLLENVIIKRLWADTLQITVTEQKLVARLGEGAAINSKGEVIFAPVRNHRLPVFMGPNALARTMLIQYNDICALLRPLNLGVVKLSVNARRAFTVTLNNGIEVLLGRKDISAHLFNFVTVFPKLKKIHGDKIDMIDLRYPSGVCVHLKS